MDVIVIHIPLKSEEIFLTFEVVAFPFSVNNSVLTLDLLSSLVLVAKDFSVYATARREDLTNCISSYSNLHHCSVSQFAYFPIADHVCEVALTHATTTKALAQCP